ncbi:MAG TPA: MFS transporter [Roseiflexaceae bacterium]|nr:MFS transporter [Roseiflexaceae bacterium]
MQRTRADQETTTATTMEVRVDTTLTTPPVTQPKPLTTALAFLSACIALLMTGFGMIVPVFPQRLAALGRGAGTLALMEGAFALGMVLFSTPIATLADRIGRKPIVLLSLAGFIVTNLVLAAINLALVFILIRFVEGVSISGLMPAALATVGDSVPRAQQGRWIGLISAAQAAGFALGPAIGGFLCQAWGLSSPFLVSAASAFIAALLALVMLPETLSEHVRQQARLRRIKPRQAEKRSINTAPPVPALLWAFLPLLLLDCGMSFIYPFVLPQYPFFFAQVLGYSPAQFGVIVSAYGLALAAFPMLLAGFGEGIPARLRITLGSLLYSALNVALLLLPPYALLLGAALLTGLGNALLMPALSRLYLGATARRSTSPGRSATAYTRSTFGAPRTAVSHGRPICVLSPAPRIPRWRSIAAAKLPCCISS